MKCAVTNCENSASSRGELCSSCERGLASLRKAIGEAEARRLLGLSSSEDSGELSLADDLAVDGDVIIDLSGGNVAHATLHTGEAKVETVLLPAQGGDLDDTDVAVIDYLIRRWQATGDRRILVELQVALNELL